MRESTQELRLRGIWAAKNRRESIPGMGISAGTGMEGGEYMLGSPWS